MIITQLVMVAIMTMTPIHIEHHGHSIGITGLVIGAHVAGMFLPSPFSGWLVDRFGYLPIAVAAGVTLLAAGLLAAWAPVDSVTMLVLALVLLGLGMEPRAGQRHNLGDERGAAGHARPDPGHGRSRYRARRRRCRAEFGLIITATSYATLTLLGGVLALLVIPIAAVARAVPSRQA